MGMGHQQMGDGLALERRQQRIDVLRDIRTRVHHSDVPIADDVRPRTVPGKRARIPGDDAPQHRRDLIHPPVLELILATEW